MGKLKDILKDVFQVFLVILILCATWLSYTPTKVKYLSEISASDTAINSNDLREIVGTSTYVFIGYVEETHDYNSKKYFRHYPKIIDYNGMPYTECKLRVVESIKGGLVDDTTFSIYKFGGVVWSRTCVLMDDDDMLPEKGKYYLFAGNCYADGTMIVGGKNKTALLEDGINETNYENSTVYKKYIEACKNQITKNATPPYYLCGADANYGDGTHNAEIYEEYNKQKVAKGGSIDKKFHKALKDGNPKIK